MTDLVAHGRRLFTRTSALLVLLALALPAAARADDAAVLYDPANVAQIELTVSDEAEQSLLADPSTYVDATFRLTVAGVVFGPKPAEVRLKGHASFRPFDRKAALKVKFAKANRPFGLKSLTLNNMVQDPSMIRETLGYEVMRAAGVAAPRTGLAYVRVNKLGYGLYLNLETYDDVMLARLFATMQHLYEADDPGVDVAPGGASTYEMEEGDEDDRSDLEALIAAANATGSDWSEGMAGTADLDAMTRMWAAEQYLGHWDGYSVRGGPHSPSNYYLHSDEAGVFTMLPSGLDQTFDLQHPFPGSGDGVLVARCLADASCLEAFRTNLGAVSAAADAMGIGTRLDVISATVAAWRPCPDREHAGDAKWQAAVTGARAFVRDRRAAVASYLGAPAPAAEPALESTTPPPLSTAGCPAAPDPPPAPPRPPPVTPDPDPPPPDPPPKSEPALVPPAAVALAGFTPVPSRAPRLAPRRLTARVSPGADLRPPYRFTTSVSLLPPAGVGRARACEGRVAVRFRAGTRTIAMGGGFLRRNCTFSSSVAFEDASVFAGRRTLTVQVRFKGNDALLPRSAATRTVAVRRVNAGL